MDHFNWGPLYAERNQVGSPYIEGSVDEEADGNPADSVCELGVHWMQRHGQHHKEGNEDNHREVHHSSGEDSVVESLRSFECARALPSMNGSAAEPVRRGQRPLRFSKAAAFLEITAGPIDRGAALVSGAPTAARPARSLSAVPWLCSAFLRTRSPARYQRRFPLRLGCRLSLPASRGSAAQCTYPCSP
jgi:hypothetical protein